MRLLSVSILKLARRPAMFRTTLVMLAVLALSYLTMGASARTLPAGEADNLSSMLRFPEAFTSLAGILATLGGIGGAALAGTVAGSDWSWGTLRVAIARGVSRSDYVLATVAALAAMAIVGWLVLFAAGTLLVALSAALGGLPIGDPTAGGALARLPVLLAVGWWGIVMQIAIGFAVAFATRSQIAGIAVVVGLVFAEQFAAVIAPADTLQFAPITAASLLVKNASTLGVDGQLVVPLVTTTLYVVLAVAGAALVARRAEVA